MLFWCIMYYDAAQNSNRNAAWIKSLFRWSDHQVCILIVAEIKTDERHTHEYLLDKNCLCFYWNGTVRFVPILRANAGNNNRLCCLCRVNSHLVFSSFDHRLIRFSPAETVAFVSVESRHGNRSAAERKRPALRPGHSVTQTQSTRVHSCAHFHSANKRPLLTSNAVSYQLQNCVRKYYQRRREDLSRISKVHYFMWDH